MKKARESIQELEQQYMREDAPTLDVEDLKIEINNLLHMHLPSTVKLGQMEAISVTIYDIIKNPENYLNPTK